MYKALILDMDGTVIDSERMVELSLQKFLAGYGLTLTEELLKLAFSSPNPAFIAALGLDEDPVFTARKRREIEIGMLDEITLFPGIEAVLAAPIRRGLVTSEAREELDLNLRALGISGCFELAVCADELPYQKPRPEPLNHCVARMGLGARDVLFVGDTPSDRDCARDAGVDFALAAWGADAAMDATGARFIFTRPEEILAHIRSEA